MPSLLGLDLSTRTGWAWWKHHEFRPVCGTEKLPKAFDPADYAARTWPLMKWLEQFISDHKVIEAIAYESPFIPMAPLKPKDGESAFNTTMHTLRLQIALATTIETVAKKHRIRCVEVATQSAKVAMVGYGRKPKDDPKFDWKKAMLLGATRLGYAVADDHQADAIAVSLVAYEYLWGIEV